jgi:hypothetical protein
MTFAAFRCGLKALWPCSLAKVRSLVLCSSALLMMCVVSARQVRYVVLVFLA